MSDPYIGDLRSITLESVFGPGATESPFVTPLFTSAPLAAANTQAGGFTGREIHETASEPSIFDKVFGWLSTPLGGIQFGDRGDDPKEDVRRLNDPEPVSSASNLDPTTLIVLGAGVLVVAMALKK